jgi:peptidoglycan/LPS O-acetylase OafA/YrhL
METAKTSTSSYYRPELDVVRFVAFLLVFLHHTLPSGKDIRVLHLFKGFAPAYDAFSTACGYGLSLFFTLSAFLICELLLRERSSTGSIDVKQFYIRRILRIWPLYYLAITLGSLAARAKNSSASAGLPSSWAPGTQSFTLLLSCPSTPCGASPSRSSSTS